MAQQDSALQHMTNLTTKENILNWLTAQIYQWIETVILYIHHHLATARQKAILHTCDIWSFFPSMNIYHWHNYKPP